MCLENTKLKGYMDGCKLKKNTGIYLVRSFFTLVALGARLYLLLQGGALTMIAYC